MLENSHAGFGTPLLALSSMIFFELFSKEEENRSSLWQSIVRSEELKGTKPAFGHPSLLAFHWLQVAYACQLQHCSCMSHSLQSQRRTWKTVRNTFIWIDRSLPFSACEHRSCPYAAFLFCYMKQSCCFNPQKGALGFIVSALLLLKVFFPLLAFAMNDEDCKCYSGWGE